MECEFHNNVSANEGGGAYSRSMHNAMLMDCVFTGNSAVTGGGMYNASGGSTMISNCTFNNNFAYLSADGTHPNAEGYALIASTFFDAIRRDLEAPPTLAVPGLLRRTN